MFYVFELANAGVFGIKFWYHLPLCFAIIFSSPSLWRNHLIATYMRCMHSDKCLSDVYGCCMMVVYCGHGIHQVPIENLYISRDECLHFGCGWELGVYFLGGGHLQPCGCVFNPFKCYYQGCPNNPIFSILGLGAACWTHLMCHHELGSTSVSHSFSIPINIIRILYPNLGVCLPKFYCSIMLS